MTDEELRNRFDSLRLQGIKTDKKRTEEDLKARFDYLQSQGTQLAQQNVQPVQTTAQPAQPSVQPIMTHGKTAQQGLQQAQEKIHATEKPMTAKLQSGQALTPEETIRYAQEQGKITSTEANKKLKEIKEPLKNVKIEGKDNSWTVKNDIQEFKDTIDTIGKGTVVFGARALDALDKAKNYANWNDTSIISPDNLANYVNGKRDTQSGVAFSMLRQMAQRSDRQDDMDLQNLYNAIAEGRFTGNAEDIKNILNKSQIYQNNKQYQTLVQPSLEKYEQRKQQNIAQYPGMASTIMNTGSDILSHGIPTVLGMGVNPTAGLALSGGVTGETKMQQYLAQGKDYTEAAKNIPIETAKGLAFGKILEVASPILSSGIAADTPTLARAARAFANGFIVGTGASAATQSLDLLKDDPNYDYIDWNRVEKGLKTGEYKSLDDYLASDEFTKDVAGSRAKQMAISALMTAAFNTAGQVQQGMRANQTAKAVQASNEAKADEYLKTLGLKRGATEEQVRKAARQLSAQFHPDRNPGFEEQFNQVRTAYAELSKPEFAFVYGKGVVPTTVAAAQQPVNTANAVASDQALVPYAGQAVTNANNIGNMAAQQATNIAQPMVTQPAANIPQQTSAENPPQAITPNKITTNTSLENIRDFKNVGNRNVKAYQFENPEVKPFFQYEAKSLLDDLNNAIKGEKWANWNNGELTYGGTKRAVVQDIADLLDGNNGVKLSYDDIKKGLNAIIENHGSENIAAAKRIEMVLDKRLREGYTDYMGYEHNPSENYNKFLSGQEYMPPAEYDNQYLIKQYGNPNDTAANLNNNQLSEINDYIKNISNDTTLDNSFKEQTLARFDNLNSYREFENIKKDVAEYKNSSKSSSTKNGASKEFKKDLENKFKELTGDSILRAEATLAGVDLRNMQRKAGNSEGELEAYPYSKEAMDIYNRYQNSKKSSSYLYHATGTDRLESILKNGITTGNKQNQEGVSSDKEIYLSATPELAESYAPNDSVTLRINPKFYDKFENFKNDLLGGEGSYSITNNIPPEMLQIKENNKWIPLLNSKQAKQANANIDQQKQPSINVPVEKTVKPKQPENMLPTNEELKQQETKQIAKSSEALRNSNRIQDFGEKIGGARKDISTPLIRKTKQVIPNYTVEPAKTLGDDGQEIENYSVKFKGKVLSDGFKTQQEAVDFINNFKNHVKKNAANVQERTRHYTNGDTKTVYEVTVTDSKSLKTRSTGKYFDNKEDAESFALALSMYISEHGKSLFRPTLQRVERYNPSANNSTKATGQEIIDKFKFRAGEFGNWVNNAERQRFLNYGYDALSDLATAMEVAPEDISYGGKMAIAFGARGHGLTGALAHFEPLKKVINMTKLKGAGSVAHEMGHGFDNYLSRINGYDEDGMMSTTSRQKNLPKPVKDAFDHLIDTIKYSISTDEAEIAKKNNLYEKARKEHLNYHLNYYDKVFDGKATRYKKVKGEYKNVPIEVTDEQKKEYQRIRKILEEGKLDSKRDYDLANTGRNLKSVVTYGNDIEKLKSMIKEITGRKVDDDTIYWIYRYGQPSQQVKEIRSESAFSKSAKELDAFTGRADGYHSKIEEMLARSFETFINDELEKKGITSQYLVHSVYNDKYALFNPYPAGEERKAINAAWRELINVMKQEGYFHQGNEMTALADHDTNRGYNDEAKPKSARKTTTTVTKTDLQAKPKEAKPKETPPKYDPKMLPPNEEIQKVDKNELLPTTEELKQFEQDKKQAEIEAVRKGAKALGLEKEPTPPIEPPTPPTEKPTEPEEIPDYPDDKIAQLLKEKPQRAKMTKKEMAENAYKTLVNKGYYVDKLAEESGNPQLKYKYDRMLASANEGNYVVGEKQTDNEGNIIGKSVNEIWKPVEDAGKVEEFSDYLLHKLNINRMSLEDIDAITKADIELTDFIKNNPEIGGLSPNKLKKLAKGDDENAEKARQLIELDKQAEILENRKNKPVFGETVTANDSRKIVAEYEKNNPEFIEWSKDINTFNKNQLQNMVDAGLASEETQQLLNDMYDNYIRIQREVGGDRPIVNQRGRLKVNSPIKKAKGGNQDILPLKDSMAQQAVEVKKAISRNLFGQELLNTIGGGEEVEDYGEILNKGKNGEAPTFTVFKDGNPVTMKINTELYDTLKPSERATWEDSVIANGLQKAVVLQKTLLTSRNPIFAFTNFVRDLETAIVNSTDTPKMLNNYKKLAQYKFAQTFGRKLTDEQEEIGRLWELYKANGGESNTYFDFEKGTNLESSNPVKREIDKVTDKIFGVNEIVEQMPRVAEFITTLENGGTIDEAMYNAADITVNFKRGGEFTKMLDRNGASFLNASVQGLDKQIRNFSKKRGGKGFAKMVITCALLGIAPQLLNHVLLSDDEDYQDLPDYVKDNYWLFKTGDDTFIRIPRGRDIPTFLGVLAQRTKRATEGDDHAFDGLVDTFSNSLAPNNPLDSNIFSPITAMGTNKSWSGNDIVSSALSNKVPSEQYDAKDTEFAKWLAASKLGKQFGWSPKKIDYLLDQYSGGIGDILIPMNTKYAEESNPLSAKFMTDSVSNNKQLSRFYDTKTELAQRKTSGLTDDTESFESQYLNNVGDKISKLSSKRKDVEMSDLPDKEKIAQARELTSQINEEARNANNSYKKLGETYDKFMADDALAQFVLKNVSDDKTEAEKEVMVMDAAKLYSYKEVLGGEYAVDKLNLSDKMQEKYEDSGIDADIFFEAYMAQKYESSDKDTKDKTIPLSKGKNRKTAIDNAVGDELSKAKKEELYGIFNISEKVW